MIFPLWLLLIHRFKYCIGNADQDFICLHGCLLLLIDAYVNLRYKYLHNNYKIYIITILYRSFSFIYVSQLSIYCVIFMVSILYSVFACLSFLFGFLFYTEHLRHVNNILLQCTIVQYSAMTIKYILVLMCLHQTILDL